MPNPSPNSPTPDDLQQKLSQQAPDVPDGPWWEAFMDDVIAKRVRRAGPVRQQQPHTATKGIGGPKEEYHWDADAGVLRIGRATLELFPRGKRRAPEQEAILDAFERAGWPEILEVHDVEYMNVTRLNKRIAKLSNVPLVFHVLNGCKEILRARC